MAEVELRITADLDSATKEVAGFRKEYADLVRAVAKPLGKVNATRDLERDLEGTEQQIRNTKGRLKELQSELIRSEQPTVQLRAAFKEAGSELRWLEQAEVRQVSQLRKLRAELAAAGVDSTRLASEQRRLHAELNAGLSSGRADAAAAGIRSRAAALKMQAVAQRQANIEQARSDLGVNRYRAVQAEIQKLAAQYELLRTKGNLSVKELAVAQQQLVQRIRESRQEMAGLANSQGGGLAGGLGRIAPVAAGVAGAAGIATAYGTATDAIKQMEAQLRLATNSQEEFSRAQAETFRIAQENQAPLGDVVKLYSRLAPALQGVGRGQGDALKIIDAVTKSLRISGATAEETASTIQQFAQALGSGVLRGEEFNTLAESSPRLLRALADGLHVNVGALREMAAQGKLTADVIADTLIGQLDTLSAEAQRLPDTFGGALTRLANVSQAALQKLDKATGTSDRIVKRLNGLAAAISGLTSASDTGAAVQGISQLSVEFARLVPLLDLAMQGSQKALELTGFDEAASALDASAKQEAKVYDFREERLRAHAEQVRALHQQSLEDTKSLLKQQVDDTKKLLQEQVAAERKAAGELESAKKAQLDTQQRYKDALAALNAGSAQAPSYGQASALKAGARQALQQGDVEEAKRQAQAALAILQELAAAGENTYGFGGFIKELQSIEESADQKGIDEAQQKLEKAKDTVATTKAALEELKDLEVKASMSPEAEQALLDQMAALAKKIGILLTVPVTPVVPEAGTAGPATAEGAPPAGYAEGGWTGPGGKYDPAGIVHADEHVQPKHVVREPGALPFLERIRRYGFQNTMGALRDRLTSGLRGYAEGGLVARALPVVPPIAPSLLQSAGNQYLGDTTLVLPGGESLTVSVPTDQAENFKALRLKFGSPSRPRRN